MLSEGSTAAEPFSSPRQAYHVVRELPSKARIIEIVLS